MNAFTGAMKKLLIFKIFFITTLLLISIFSGRLVGSLAQGDYFFSRKVLWFVSAPVDIFLIIESLVSDGDPYNRMCGYQALSDYKKVDNKFLEERYHAETEILLKKFVVDVIASGKHDSLETLKILSEKEKDSFLKNYIIESIKSIDLTTYKLILEKNGLILDKPVFVEWRIRL